MTTNNLRFASLLFIFIILMIVIFRGESIGIKITEELLFKFLVFICKRRLSTVWQILKFLRG